MKAIVFDKTLQLTDIEKPTPKPGEALIRMTLAGVCNTDLELIKGYMNFTGVLGHEFVGIVEALHESETQEVKDYWLNRRVVGGINCGCGECEMCRKLDARHCPNRTTLGIDRRNGVFSSHFLLPIKNLLPVPANVSDRQAVLTEPLAAAFEITEQLHVRPIDKVTILGDGKLGLMVASVLSLTCCDLTIVGRHQDKLAIVKGLAKTVLQKDFTANEDQDIVVEATGSAEGISMAIRAVKPRGTIVMKSTVADNTNMNFSPIVVKELTVLGSRCGPFAPALRCLASGHVNTEAMISGCYTIEHGLEAFRAASTRGSMKVLIEP